MEPLQTQISEICQTATRLGFMTLAHFPSLIWTNNGNMEEHQMQDGFYEALVNTLPSHFDIQVLLNDGNSLDAGILPLL